MVASTEVVQVGTVAARLRPVHQDVPGGVLRDGVTSPGELHRERATTEGTRHRCRGRHVGAHDAQSLKRSEREGYNYRRSAELAFHDAHLLTPSFHCSFFSFDFSHPPRRRPKPKGGGEARQNLLAYRERVNVLTCPSASWPHPLHSLGSCAWVLLHLRKRRPLLRVARDRGVLLRIRPWRRWSRRATRRPRTPARWRWSRRAEPASRASRERSRGCTGPRRRRSVEPSSACVADVRLAIGRVLVLALGGVDPQPEAGQGAAGARDRAAEVQVDGRR